LPLFARQGSIIPRWPLMQHTGQLPTPDLTIDVFAASEGSSFVYYEDDGHSNAFHNGHYRAIEYRAIRNGTGISFAAHPKHAGLPLPTRRILLWLHRLDNGVTRILLNQQELVARQSLEQVLAAGGFWYDANELALLAVFDDRSDFELEAIANTAITELRPDVLVTFRVQLPDNTPIDQPIRIVSSQDWQTHHELTWVSQQSPKIAQGQLALRRGAWFEYKFTRGSWGSVEKNSDCGEAKNRYGFAAAYPTRSDTVAAWADICQ